MQSERERKEDIIGGGLLAGLIFVIIMVNLIVSNL